jgi:anti-sigma B factor antagonist
VRGDLTVAPTPPSCRHDSLGVEPRLAASGIPQPRLAEAGTGTLVVSVAGELDTATDASLRARLADAVASHPRAIVVDATEVTFCSAGGLSAFLSAAEEARKAGIRFALHTRAHAVLRPVRLLGLEEVLPIHRSPAEVRTWLDPAGPDGDQSR